MIPKAEQTFSVTFHQKHDNLGLRKYQGHSKKNYKYSLLNMFPK